MSKLTHLQAQNNIPEPERQGGRVELKNVGLELEDVKCWLEVVALELGDSTLCLKELLVMLLLLVLVVVLLLLRLRLPPRHLRKVHARMPTRRILYT